MNSRCPFQVVVCIFLILLKDKISTEYSYEPKTFCFWSNGISDGQTHYMFLQQSVQGDVRLDFLFDSIWNRARDPVDCVMSSEPALTESYRIKCWEARGRPFSETADGRFNISRLTEPGGPCVAVGRLDARTVSTRRARDLHSVADQRRLIQQETEGRSPALRRAKRAWMIPGTLWCGAGNQALNFSELGVFEETDKCCRAHDHCEETIASFEYDYGVFNSNIFTLSHCDCDRQFRRCLHDARDSMSDWVGYGYFNLLKMRCFEFSQRLQCAKRSWWGMCKLSQLTKYALVRDPMDYNSTFSELEEEKLNLTFQHTISLENLGGKTGLVMSSTPFAYNTSRGHSMYLGHQMFSTAHLSQQAKVHRDSSHKPSFEILKTQIHFTPQTTELLQKHSGKSQAYTKTGFLHTQTDSQTDSAHTRTDLETDTAHTQTDLETDTAHTQTDSETDSAHTQTDLETDTAHTQTDSLTNSTLTQTDSETDSAHTQTDLKTDTAHTQTDSLTNSTHTQTDSETDSAHTQTETDSAHTQTETDSAHTQTDLKTDSAHTQTNSRTDSAHTQTDSETDSEIETPQKHTDSQTDSPQTQNVMPHIQTDLSQIHTESEIDSPDTQINSQTNSTLSTKKVQTKTAQKPQIQINSPKSHDRPTDQFRTCSFYKDLDSCQYHIPAQQEKFGLRNTDHTTLYHCNCTARLAKELAEQDSIHKVHRLLLDFVSQRCFIVPQNCTRSESCSVSSPPPTDHWTKDEAVWRHLAAAKRQPKRINVKRAKRKNSSFRLYKKCLRLHSKLQRTQLTS